MKLWIDAQIAPAIADWMRSALSVDAVSLHALGLGTPPQIVWLRCGNTSSARLREILARTWPRARDLIDAGERIVEIVDRQGS